MEKFTILLGYFDKQMKIAEKLHKQLLNVDLSSYDSRYTFAMKGQQFYTAIEDLLKQIAKSFENHIQDLSSSHKELLVRLNIEIPKIRPPVLSEESFLFLNKLLAFRHFVRHAYDCELNEHELIELQNKLKIHFKTLKKDFMKFRDYIETLSDK